MSEPSTLFASISISEENYAAFLEAKPATPVLDNNWINWWNALKMYSKSELTENDLRVYNKENNEEILQDFLFDETTHFGFSDYDKENKSWTFGMIYFSENYFEMIPMIAFIKSVANYKEINDHDFAIIYPYFWEEEVVDVFIYFKDKEALLKENISSTDEIDQDKIQRATDYLENKHKELSKKFED